MQRLPTELYTVDSIVALEHTAIEKYAIPAYELMERAGRAVFDLLDSQFEHCRRVLVICGAGNNAGDGYVVARLAKEAGYQVDVISLVDPHKLHGEAIQAYQDWSSVVGDVASITRTGRSVLSSVDIIVDAMLGTGLRREIDTSWAAWIEAINDSGLPVISVDIPSGIFADTGSVSSAGAIRATHTVCFIGLKQGMFTAQAPDYCGEVHYDSLGLSMDVRATVKPDALLLEQVDYQKLPPRRASSHKGDFGHVLIVGGNQGMPGALILAASAALRSGAGRVTVVTIPSHLQVVAQSIPEVMIKVCESDQESIDRVFDDNFIAGITHVAIGMGLGQDDWSRQLLQRCIDLGLPLLIDADALNLLAGSQIAVRSPVIITPHPGEAKRLLAGHRAGVRDGLLDVQRDRFHAIKALRTLFAGESQVVLKGAGTLLYDGESIRLCRLGNAAMATAGMGDVLSGIIIGLLSQGLDAADAVELGVCLHACAADRLMQGGTRGLLASDIVTLLPEVLR